MSEKPQYDEIRKSYLELASAEPSKQFVQYPEVLKLLGEVRGKKILDVGCGPGLLTRMVAEKGASVTAYDNSVEQIHLAEEEEKSVPLGTQYAVADSHTIEKTLADQFGISSSYFDEAISTLVLHYAEDRAELDEFFSSTHRLLKEEGRFIAVVCNPDYKKLNVPAYNRIFYRKDGKMGADFLDPSGSVKFSITFSDFPRAEYEASARDAGFKSMEWIDLKISPEGRQKMGEVFWNDFEQDCPYVTFIATK